MPYLGYEMKKIAIILAFLMSISSVNANDPISTTMTVFIVKENGQLEQVIKTNQQQVKPGQMLEYVISYKNNTSMPLNIQSADAIVPNNTVFVESSNKTKEKADFLVSIDQGKTFEAPPVKRIKKVESKEIEYEVPVEQYTHVRWAGQPAIAAGSTQNYRYRVKVN